MYLTTNCHTRLRSICRPAARPKHFRINNSPTKLSQPAPNNLKNSRTFPKNGRYVPNVEKSHRMEPRNVSAKNSSAVAKICMISPINAFKMPITIADKFIHPFQNKYFLKKKSPRECPFPQAFHILVQKFGIIRNLYFFSCYSATSTCSCKHCNDRGQ